MLQTLSAQQQDEIRARQTRLAALQQEPDSPEALATIPHVCLSDLPRDPAPVPTELREDGSVIIHDLQTDGIVYTTAYFAADDLTPEELPYLTLLRSVLSQLPAGEMDAQELQKQLRLRLGSFSVGVSPITQLRDPQAYQLYATASCSALGSKLPEALSLAAAILTKTDFTNRGKLLEILRQLRDGLQQQIVSSGSSFAMLRASAALNAAGACTERSGGVDFYRWLCALEREFDARADACIAALQRLSEKLFVAARLRLSVTGGTEDERQTVLRVLREALPAGQGTRPGVSGPAAADPPGGHRDPVGGLVRRSLRRRARLFRRAAHRLPRRLARPLLERDPRAGRRLRHGPAAARHGPCHGLYLPRSGLRPLPRRDRTHGRVSRGGRLGAAGGQYHRRHQRR